MYLHRIDCRALCVSVAILFAAESVVAQPDDRKQRREAMKIRAALLSAKFSESDGDRPAPLLLKAPLLRLNDPTREEIDGTLWLWQSGSRPVAVLCLFFIRGQWNYEHVSLTDHALEVTGRPDWTWEPVAKSRQWFRLEHPVSDNPAARGRQMRSAVRELKASEFHRRQTYVLRLMPRPLYMYADEDASILAGGLFALSHGTNPEVIVQIEARRDAPGKAAWFVSFARLSAAEVTISRAEKVLWQVPPMLHWNSRNDYYSAHGPDPIE